MFLKRSNYFFCMDHPVLALSSNEEGRGENLFETIHKEDRNSPIATNQEKIRGQRGTMRALAGI